MASGKREDIEETTIRVDGAITIYEVGDIHKKFVECIKGEKGLRIDLQGVTDCDTSGIQLLCSAAETAKKKGIKISITNIPEVIRMSAEGIGVEIKLS